MTINIDVSDDMVAAFRAVAHASNKTFDDVVRAVLEGAREWREREPAFAEAAWGMLDADEDVEGFRTRAAQAWQGMTGRRINRYELRFEAGALLRRTRTRGSNDEADS